MKWNIYVFVFVYMCNRIVNGRILNYKEIISISVDNIDYGKEEYLLPGSVISIPCSYSNKRQQVKWIDPSGKTLHDDKSERIYVQKHQIQTLEGGRSPALMLTFADTWVEDSGKYTCRSGRLSKSVSLCVIDPLTFVDTPSEVSVDEGRSFTLTCEARGRPEPRLVWYRNDEEILDDSNSTKYIVTTKFNSQGFQGQLTITSIESDDAGSYTCQAIQEHKDLEDCTSSKDWNITLNVNYAPVFEGGNVSTIFAKFNKTVELDCEPKAYPAPTIRWFTEVDDGTLVKYPPENVKADNDNKTKVTIVADVLSFGANYVCRATNSLGAASKTFTILETKIPIRPDEVNVFNYTDSQIVLNVTWEDGVDVFPIDDIAVQWLKIKEYERSQPRDSDWKESEEISFVVEAEVVSSEPTINVPISNLEPATSYWFRVQVGNELGYSEWSNTIEAETAEEEDSTGEAANEELSTETPQKIEEPMDQLRANFMYYGVFFAGGVLLIALVCVMVIRIAGK